MTLPDDRVPWQRLSMVTPARRPMAVELQPQVLSRFLGMVISMRYDEQAPPHFYVRYGEHRATVALDSMRLLEGFLSPRVLGLVCEWSAVRRSELIRSWWRLREGRAPIDIEPLY